LFGRTGQTAARWRELAFVGTILLVGACVQLAGIDDPHPKPVGEDAGGGGEGGGGGAGGAPNIEPDAGQDASGDANEDAGQNPVEDPEWANWPMPNPADSGLVNPADYDIKTGMGIVIDNVTKLTWQRDVDPGMFSWSGAKAYCNGLDFAGFSDWRLPTAIELISLVDFTKASPGPTIDGIAFPGTPADWFWTATPLVGVPTAAWSVTFDTGDTSYNTISDTWRVRCVR
jgi:hypothetical protein